MMRLTLLVVLAAALTGYTTYRITAKGDEVSCENRLLAASNIGADPALQDPIDWSQLLTASER